MIIEYSYDQYRLFFGLKKDGKKYFHEEIKEIELTSENIPFESIRKNESINSFVSLVNDLNKTKEYLMSLRNF